MHFNLAINLLQGHTKVFLGDIISMLGWMLIFVLFVLSATLAAFRGGIGTTFGMTSVIVFGILLALSAFTHLLRGRA